MSAALSSGASKSSSTPGAVGTGFRLGENPNPRDSDSDQSAHSERSLSPQRGAKPSKAKKKKARKQVGALTDELDTLLGAAFQTRSKDAVKPDHVSAGQAAHISGDVPMDLDAEKKLSKRTRQNMIKMEKRRLARERQKQSQPPPKTDEAQRKPLTVQGQQRLQNQSKKKSAQVRRERKERSRAGRVVGLGGDKMDIG